MDSPYDNFSDLTERLRDNFQATRIGLDEIQDVREAEAEESQPPLNKEKELASVNKSVRLQLEMSLVYGVVILEAMIKDYARFLIAPNPMYPFFSGLIDFRDNSLTTWHDEIKPEIEIKPSHWSGKVEKWSSEAIGTETTTSRRKEVTDLIIECCTAVEKWQIFPIAIVIRNLVVHNGGVMNKRNHDVVAVCEVGKEPEWSTNLLDDISSGLSLLNEHLDRLRID